MSEAASPEEAARRGAMRRFAMLATRSAADVPLAEAALLASACLSLEADVAAGLAEIDRLAGGVEPTLAAVRHRLFSEAGFRGDVADYDHPDNSLLDRVLARRRGMPITLTIVLVEVAARAGLPMVPVGMPGHVLARLRDDSERFVDAFSGGVELDPAACERVYRTIHGDDAPFDTAFLRPSTHHEILRRVLANLTRSLQVRHRPDEALVAMRLQTLVPGSGAAARHALGVALARRGRFDQAADELEATAAGVDDDLARRLRHEAAHYRARLN
ncbi:MAG: transcriptional regulator [Actinobacteria bacterium]|nr:transcriptional regulator [Actinomycetota bacterium]